MTGDEADREIEARLRRYRLVVPTTLRPPARVAPRDPRGAWWAAAAMILLGLLLRGATATLERRDAPVALAPDALLASELLGPEVGSRWSATHPAARRIVRGPVSLDERTPLDE